MARRRIADYLEELKQVVIVWMGGDEIGMIPDSRHDVYLWPYAPSHSNIEALAQTLTHEIVHIVDGLDNEGQVNAIAAALMKRPTWRLAVFLRLADEYHKAIRSLEKKVRLG